MLIGVSGVNNNFYWGISLGITLHVVMHTCIIYIIITSKTHCIYISKGDQYIVGCVVDACKFVTVHVFDVVEVMKLHTSFSETHNMHI